MFECFILDENKRTLCCSCTKTQPTDSTNICIIHVKETESNFVQLTQDRLQRLRNGAQNLMSTPETTPYIVKAICERLPEEVIKLLKIVKVLFPFPLPPSTFPHTPSLIL